MAIIAREFLHANRFTIHRLGFVADTGVLTRSNHRLRCQKLIEMGLCTFLYRQIRLSLAQICQFSKRCQSAST